MKQLIWKLILPLTVISFATFTKWWYVLPVDAPDTMMAGFPFIFLSDGWHTSMSFQIFVVEFIIDLLVYFVVWFGLLFLIDHYWIKLKVPKFLTVLLLTLAGLIITLSVIVASMPEHVYKVKRDFDMEVLVTDYRFIWQHQERPDFAQYDPRKKQNEKINNERPTPRWADNRPCFTAMIYCCWHSLLKPLMSSQRVFITGYFMKKLLHIIDLRAVFY